MKKYFIQIMALLLVITTITIMGCKKSQQEQLPEVNALESYDFNAQKPIGVRVTAPPPFVLEYLKELDGRADYIPYIPNRAERKTIEDSLSHIPKYLKKTLKRRLVGIYLIKNFWGSGLTEAVYDKKNNVHSFIVINPVVFTMDLSEYITKKEHTCFKRDASGNSVSIECRGKEDLSGFLGIFLHEAFHVYDYVHRITPYTDKGIKTHLNIQKNSTDFTKNIWGNYGDPKNKKSFQGKVTFYGFSKGPHLERKNMAKTYKELSTSPFVSLYGSQNWAEDFAELATFYHLTKKLHCSYDIYILHKGKIISQYQPIEFAFVKPRLLLLKNLYN